MLIDFFFGLDGSTEMGIIAASVCALFGLLLILLSTADAEVEKNRLILGEKGKEYAEFGFFLLLVGLVGFLLGTVFVWMVIFMMVVFVFAVLTFVAIALANTRRSED